MASNQQTACTLECSAPSCSIRFASEYYTSEVNHPHLENKFFGIQVGILSTRLFCTACSARQAAIICRINNIIIEDD